MVSRVTKGCSLMQINKEVAGGIAWEQNEQFWCSWLDTEEPSYNGTVSKTKGCVLMGWKAC